MEEASRFDDGAFEVLCKKRAVEMEWEFSCPVCGIAHRTQQAALNCCSNLFGEDCNPGDSALE